MLCYIAWRCSVCSTVLFVFFFKQKTAYEMRISDWSSDVCSSDLLLITGVGYRANAQGKTLKLQLGYSHDVDFAVPEGIEIKTPDNTTIEISGMDRQQVGQVAAEIRRWRKPEPYKGKGIKYRGEYIFRKEGKKK